MAIINQASLPNISSPLVSTSDYIPISQGGSTKSYKALMSDIPSSHTPVNYSTLSNGVLHNFEGIDLQLGTMKTPVGGNIYYPFSQDGGVSPPTFSMALPGTFYDVSTSVMSSTVFGGASMGPGATAPLTIPVADFYSFAIAFTMKCSQVASPLGMSFAIHDSFGVLASSVFSFQYDNSVASTPLNVMIPFMREVTSTDSFHLVGSTNFGGGPITVLCDSYNFSAHRMR